MPLLCQYSDVLGKPHEGVHSARLFQTSTFDGLARNDILATLVAALIIAAVFTTGHTFVVRFVFVSVGLFVLGFLMHLLFCVQTPLTRRLLSM